MTLELKRAIGRIRSLLAPPQGFTSGTKVYEPEKEDPYGMLKRGILALAVETAAAFEGPKSPSSLEVAAYELHAHEFQAQLEALEADSEIDDYNELLDATMSLIRFGTKSQGTTIAAD